MATVKKEWLFCECIIAVFFIMTVLVEGCLQEKPASAQPNLITPAANMTESALLKKTMDKVSNELGMLNSKGWNALKSDLTRPRMTTLLWYHLKKLIGFEPKIVFGNTNKLNTAIAIPVKMGGESSLPKVKIKNVDYYIIDPMTPEIVSEFDYGYIFDDPGSVMPGYFSDFRLNTDDIAIVEQWMSETGVSLSYTDFPAR